MSNGVENSSQTHGCSTGSMELNISQTTDMDHQKPDFASSVVTHQSVIAQIKLATDLILRQVEKLCALLVEKSEQRSTEDSEATSLRRDEASWSASDNRYDRAASKKIPSLISYCF